MEIHPVIRLSLELLIGFAFGGFYSVSTQYRSYRTGGTCESVVYIENKSGMKHTLV